MSITLTRGQEQRLQAHIASGDFPSVEEGARQLIDERITEHEIENDDMAWAKPLIDEAIAAVERGGVITLEEHKARNAARLAAMKRVVPRLIISASADADTANILAGISAKPVPK